MLGLKVGSYWPGNAAQGLAAHGSVVLLLDPETGRLMAVVETRRREGRSDLEAMKDGLKAVLCSPAFLYMVEPDAAAVKERALLFDIFQTY